MSRIMALPPSLSSRKDGGIPNRQNTLTGKNIGLLFFRPIKDLRAEGEVMKRASESISVKVWPKIPIEPNRQAVQTAEHG